ncbi:pannexin-1 isoform X1 [Ammospiza nelsoni]|uniref:pannexin-1 isoform X1 n=1 Tax=Ammospiza caudacuta TaxID=2857398 RepID=UPI0027388456|nr:pannexin-1 isoform X1 [Ammospiza caudacuta]XP_059349798.1 pannexin-1 isoform X1 [Ammospiza nelsoni]
MAIAHIATEYVFSDFLLKEPPETRYKGLRLELALDKIVTCIAVGLPLLLISLAFAQEVSIGAQISCFAPSSFSWRQAAYVDSYCWAAVQQKQPSHNNLENIPLSLHKLLPRPVKLKFCATVLKLLFGHGQFFPYILLLVAILLYLPCLFWRFTAAPHLSSDLKFIMEELDKAYNRAIKAANSIRSGDPRDPADLIPAANENLTQSLWEISESYFKYPIVEQYLKTKKNSKCLIIKYITCRLLTLVIIFIACLYLGYYIRLSSLSDEFLCTIKTGILKNDTTVPEVVQCKLIAVGVFKVLSYINLIVYLMVMPLVVYAMFVPWRWNSGVLKVYEILPTFDVLKLKSNHFDDLSLYLLFLEENVSELKSYKCLKVLENIAVSEKFDVMQLLVNLGTIKTDTIDGKPGTAELEKPEETTTEELEKDATELQVLTDRDASGSVNMRDDKRLRQRLVDSSC